MIKSQNNRMSFSETPVGEVPPHDQWRVEKPVK